MASTLRRSNSTKHAPCHGGSAIPRKLRTSQPSSPARIGAAWGLGERAGVAPRRGGWLRAPIAAAHAAAVGWLAGRRALRRHTLRARPISWRASRAVVSRSARRRAVHRAVVPSQARSLALWTARGPPARYSRAAARGGHPRAGAVGLDLRWLPRRGGVRGERAPALRLAARADGSLAGDNPRSARAVPTSKTVARIFSANCAPKLAIDGLTSKTEKLPRRFDAREKPALPPARDAPESADKKIMANPYIPPRDADFDAWLINFATLIAVDPTDYGLIAGDATAISAVKNAWVAAYATAINPSTRTSATIASKDAARATAEQTVRPYAIRIRNNAAVSDALKIGVGVTIPSTPPVPIPAPTDAPALSIVRAIPLEMTLGYKTAGAIGKAKPFGAIGIELWRSVGTVPAVDPAQCAFQLTATKSPTRQAFLPADQGKIVTFFSRFVTRSGPQGIAQTGPWSAPLTLVVM